MRTVGLSPRPLRRTAVSDNIQRVLAKAVTEPTSIGARVRALRESMGLSLRDLAARTAVSAPMLSQVERGETSPTVAVAARIAAGLELSLSQLLRLDEGGTVSVVRAAERRAGGPNGGGHHYEAETVGRRSAGNRVGRAGARRGGGADARVGRRLVRTVGLSPRAPTDSCKR